MDQNNNIIFCEDEPPKKLFKDSTQWIVKTQQRNGIGKKNLSYFLRSFSKLETNPIYQQFMDKTRPDAINCIASSKLSPREESDNFLREEKVALE